MQDIKNETGEEIINQTLTIESGALKVLEDLEKAVEQSGDKTDAAIQVLSRVAWRLLSSNGRLTPEQTLENLARFDIAVTTVDLVNRGSDPTEFLQETGLLPKTSGLN